MAAARSGRPQPFRWGFLFARDASALAVLKFCFPPRRRCSVSSLKSLRNQHDVETEHDDGGNHGDRPGWPRCWRTAHDVGAAVKIRRRDHRQRQREAQDHLADHQRIRRIGAEATTTKAGSMVIRRRSQIGMRKPTKPCMIICPAMVPTAELDMPEAISDNRKTPAAAAAEQRRQRVIGGFDFGDVGMAGMERARRHHHHRHVDQARDAPARSALPGWRSAAAVRRS